MEDFATAFRQEMARDGTRSTWSPAQVLEAWAWFVGRCEDGYDSGLYEFENERSIRDAIERVLLRVEHGDKPAQFVASVRDVDVRYRSLLSYGPVIDACATVWWRARLPAVVGEEMAEDVLRVFGIAMEQFP